MAKRHKEGPFLPKTGRSTGTTEWALAELLGPAALYAGLFLYLLIWVSPVLIHHVQEPFFLANRSFLIEHLARPGGLMEYLGAFFGLFFRIGWAGAAILTALTAILCVSWRYCLRRLGMPAGATRHLLPAFFVAWAHGRYETLLSSTAAVVVAVVLLALFLLVPPRAFWPKQLVFIPLSCLVYSVCGGVVVLFLALYLFHLFFDEAFASSVSLKAKIAAAAIATVYVLALPWAASVVYYGGLPVIAYEHLIPQRWKQGVSIEVILLESAMVVIGLLSAIAARHCERVSAGPLGRAWFAFKHSRWAGWALVPLTGFLLLSCTLLLSFNRNEKTLVTLDFLADSGRWKDYLFLLDEASSHPVFTRPPEEVLPDLAPVLLNTNRSLSHEGLLAEKIFSYPQTLGVSSLLPSDQKFCLLNRQVLLPYARLSFELGRVNEAEQMFYDAWAYCGCRASLLRDLARLNIVKGRFEAARVFLNILKQAPFERAWAVATEEQMDRDPSLAWDQRLKWIRSCNLTEDCVGTSAYGAQEKVLALLLVANPQNKMAYDYLMGTFLLTGQEENLVNYMAMLRNFGYNEIPRHYEEATLAYLARKNPMSVNLYGYKIKGETVRRFKGFEDLAAPCGGDPAKLWSALSATHADTYWFHHKMGMTGISLKNGKIGGLAGEAQ